MECLKNGLIVYVPSNHNDINLIPPLIINQDQVNIACQILNNVFKKLEHMF